MSQQSPDGVRRGTLWQQFKHRSPESKKKTAAIVFAVFLPIMHQMQSALMRQSENDRPRLTDFQLAPQGATAGVTWKVSPPALGYIEIAREAAKLEKRRFDSQNLKEEHQVRVDQLLGGISYVVSIHAWYEGSKYAVMPEIASFTIQYDEKQGFSLDKARTRVAPDGSRP
jgi:hypothetical protein